MSIADRKSSARWALLVVGILLASLAVPWLRQQSAPDQLTVYCAHDSIFADEIIRLFEQRSGIRVNVRYDTEANKSLGLTNLLLEERAAPRCDVFWNNQALGTMRLQREGILQPFQAENAVRIPDRYKDPTGAWTGFGGRLRVYLVNTERCPFTDTAELEQALQSEPLDDVAIAVPLFGTTLSHYSAICSERSLTGLLQWHQSLHQRGIREVRGNSGVKDLVAEGVCRFGLTDTDDAFAAIDRGKPVRMIPARLPSQATICIPNSVAIIQGCRHEELAKQFVNFLLSEEVELRLAQSASRQIPLGAIDESQLPEDVRQLRAAAA
ncbi:MAG: substrate-binding domain-containing protein, partial [Planctomycetaceae bacterium]|nr:substrate-binding domain-containing protein [Planctomycetaceae bacterium]